MGRISRSTPPTASYLAESQQADLYAAAAILSALSVLAVGMRFWCRWIKNSGYRLDDFLIAFALVSLGGLTVNGVWMLHNGLGKHIEAGGPNVVHDFWLGYFIGEVTYTGVIVSVKFSILALYWRIFRALDIKREIWIMSTIVFLWGVAVYTCMMQHCYPLRKYWDRDVPGVCKLNDRNYFFAISIPNILIDIILLILPIRYVVRLEMARHLKRATTLLFLLGGFVCIASILRMVSVVISNEASPDLIWAYAKFSKWAVVECGAAIICGCLPCLLPVWRIILPWAWRGSSGVARRQRPEWPLGSDPREDASKRRRGIFSDSVLVTKNSNCRLASENVPDGYIKVTDEWTVESGSATSVAAQDDWPVRVLQPQAGGGNGPQTRS